MHFPDYQLDGISNPHFLVLLRFEIMDKTLLIKKYSEALEEGCAAIFAGAGLSAGAGFVNWSGLLHDVASELGVNITNTTKFEDLAQYFVNENRNTTELSSTIINSFPTSTSPTENHRILSSLPIDTYWTTNFDKLIEKSLEDAGKVCDVKSLPERLAISKIKSNVCIYKMHGDVDNPDKTILTRDQFENYPQTHKAFLNNFGYDLANKTFLFLGLSFDDPNLRFVLKYARLLYKQNQRIHYYILRKTVEEKDECNESFENRKRLQELFVEDLKNYGIKTVFIDDYKEITEILKSIRDRYLRRTIYISGAAVKYDPYKESEFKEFVKSLCADIIQHGFRIVTGYGLGLGNEVIAGAVGELNKEHKPVDGNLFIFPFPQGFKDKEDIWPQYRKEMISLTGVTLFLLGNKNKGDGNLKNSDGVRQEYEISKKNGNFLIPVGATGYMAKELWDEQIIDISSRSTIYNDYIDLLKALGDNSLSLSELREKIIYLLDIITK